jgi:HlyD family secretion protein
MRIGAEPLRDSSMKVFIRLVIVVIIAGSCWGGWQYYAKVRGTPLTTYRTVPVQRGELLATIGATGTLEPEEVVDVGAQVQGRIINFGPDPGIASKVIDYNTEVNEGTVLAQIDDSLYASDVEQSKAQVQSAVANLAKAQADLRQFKAKFVQAGRDWKRAQETGKGVMSQADIDAFQGANDSAEANVAAAEAGVMLAKAGVASAQASLKRAEQNLGYCIIKSPVKGVIIDRRVNVGQTVVSSLNAPSLFLIAKDLTKMQIWASVNEADIGSIRSEQAATFTVDANPGRIFRGTVGKIRMNAQTTQNVVTYTVEINTDNSDRALRPYLTTSVQFEKARREDVLMVPNAVLRWTPTQPEQVAPEARAAMAASGSRRAKGDGATTKHSDSAVRTHGTLWMQDGNYIKPIKVKLGETDGANTEVSGDELKEGMAIISGETRPEDAAASDAKNPFMPQFGQRKKGG